MHYELFMNAALAEARAAAEAGERPHGAVAVLDDAMVAGGHEQLVATGDPTAHAVMVTIREAAQRLGTTWLPGLTVFATVEPCPMCVGALLACDADGLVYALADPVNGAAGSAVQLARAERLGRHLAVISGIRQEDAADLVAAAAERSFAGPSPVRRGA